MEGEGDDRAGIEARITALLAEADAEFGVDLDADVVEESAVVEKVVPISPFADDSAVDVSKQHTYEDGRVTVEVKKRIRCPECGYVCTGEGDALHPSVCPDCGVRFTDLDEEMERGDLDPTDEERLLIFVNEFTMKNGVAPTRATCVREGPFGRSKTRTMLEDLVASNRLVADRVERDGTEVRVYRPP
jgi:hypothetical protein